jgi:hypothetical protein
MWDNVVTWLEINSAVKLGTMGVHRPQRHKQKFLLIVDHDNERYTIEPAVYDHVPWLLEIQRACRAGRLIDFRMVTSSKIPDILRWANDIGYELWPPKSILVPPDDSNGDVDHNLGLRSVRHRQSRKL